MSIGIKSYGAYLPKYMLPRELIAKAWDFPSVPGTKAVAMADEDSLTMSVEAGLNCLIGFDPKTVDGLFFASTTQVYTEKDSASLIATILDMREDIITADFTDSLRSFRNKGIFSSTVFSHLELLYSTRAGSTIIKNILITNKLMTSLSNGIM